MSKSGVLGELEKQEVERAQKAQEAALDKFVRGKKLHPLDVVPEFKDVIEKHYTRWILPGRQGDEKQDPFAILENLLADYEVVIVPLSSRLRNEHEFRGVYGYTLDELLRLFIVNRDRIRPVLTIKPTRYPRIYERLFIQLRNQGIHPPFVDCRFAGLMSSISKADIPKGDHDALNVKNLELEKREQYSLHYCIKEIKELPQQGIEDFARKTSLRKKETLRTLGRELLILRLFGLNVLGSLSLNTWRAFAELGAAMLHCYYYYLVYPLTWALGGCVNYSDRDVRNMAFLRIPISTNQISHLEEVLPYSPASASMISNKTIDGIIHLKHFRDIRKSDEIIKFSSEHGQEYFDNMRLFKARIHTTDLKGAHKVLVNAKEVMVGQYNKEYEYLMRKEKVVKVPINFGVTFFTGLDYICKFLTVKDNSVPLEWKWLPRFLTAFKIPEKIKERLRDINAKDLTEKCWIKKNPFTMNGLPYALWRYNIKTKRINH